jgi:hypothetical protein
MSLSITVEDLDAILRDAPDASAAVRSIVPHYIAGTGETETNSFTVDRFVEHFRRNDKPDGIYRLGHGLELVLGRNM